MHPEQQHEEALVGRWQKQLCSNIPGAGLPMLVSSTCVVIGERNVGAPPAYTAKLMSLMQMELEMAACINSNFMPIVCASCSCTAMAQAARTHEMVEDQTCSTLSCHASV